MPEKKESVLQKTKYPHFLEWIPGNGTRYYLSLVYTGAGAMVTWLRNSDVGGPSFLVFPDAQEGMSVGYFMEKMGLDRKPDALAILDFLVEMDVIKSYGR